MEATILQYIFYVVSPIATFLAVGTAYLALLKQSKPLILVYYEPSDDIGSFIDLVICNHGNGTARNITFSEPIPVRCWGIPKESGEIDEKEFLDIEIPILAPGKSLRYDAGQYGGLFKVINGNKNISSYYNYKSPLKFNKKGNDT